MQLPIWFLVMIAAAIAGLIVLTAVLIWAAVAVYLAATTARHTSMAAALLRQDGPHNVGSEPDIAAAGTLDAVASVPAAAENAGDRQNAPQGTRKPCGACLFLRKKMAFFSPKRVRGHRDSLRP